MYSSPPKPRQSGLRPKVRWFAKGPMVSFRSRICACVTQEHVIFIPVLYLFPDRWIFCLCFKWEESNTYCSSGLRASHSESVTKGGCAGGVCTAGQSFCRPPLHPLLVVPLVTSTVLVASYCFSFVSFFPAIALSHSSFRKNIVALHALSASPELFSPL